MWDLPGPGLKPVSPALAGGFLTTAPPGKSPAHILIILEGTIENTGEHELQTSTCSFITPRHGSLTAILEAGTIQYTEHTNS